MKRVLAALILLIALATTATGCRSETSFGDCVGIDDGDRNPKLHYNLSVRNVVLGVFFFQMIFPPIIVLAYELYCPDGPAQ